MSWTPLPFDSSLTHNVLRRFLVDNTQRSTSLSRRWSQYENVIVLPHCIEGVLNNEEEFQAGVRAFRGEAMEAWREEFGLTLEEVEVWGGAVSPHEGGGEVSLPMVSLTLPTARLFAAMGCGGDLRRLKKDLNLRLWEEFAIEVPVFVWNESVAVRISYGKGVDLDGVRRLIGAVKAICGQEES